MTLPAGNSIDLFAACSMGFPGSKAYSSKTNPPVTTSEGPFQESLLSCGSSKAVNGLNNNNHIIYTQNVLPDEYSAIKSGKHPSWAPLSFMSLAT